MHECSKALLRRMHDARFSTRYFVGSGVDIGAGPDSLDVYRELFPLIGRVMEWDVDDGDAQVLDGLADDTFDFAHSSHCLEHMQDPHAALANWVRVVKPGGHLVITVPFLERLHGDPGDYSRYTRSMWERLLAEADLKPVTIVEQGGYFTHLAGLLRFLVQRAPRPLRWAGYGFFPLLDLLTRLDASPRARGSAFAAFVGGYLIVAERPPAS